MRQFSFPAREKLKSRKSINCLFESGKQVYAPPLKLLWLEEDFPGGILFKTGVSVPKKNFRKAVHRNLLKRRIREAFRLNKHLISSDLGENGLKGRALFFIYTSGEISGFQEIEKAMIRCLKKIH